MKAKIFKLNGTKANRPEVFNQVAAMLLRGGVGVLPTDTLYGIVASAFNKPAVAKIYRLRKRQPNKPFIILISSARDLKSFGVVIDKPSAVVLRRVWPGKVSVILPCLSGELRYLHRGSKTLAFRLPGDVKLRALLRKTGPLVAPSANWEGQPPALTITEAQKYFGSKLNFYIDAGIKKSLPSTLIKIQNGYATVLRSGAVKIQ